MSHMFYQYRGYSNISRVLKILDYGIQKERVYHLLPTQTKIGQVAFMTREVQVDQCSTWVSVWYLG
jgi:hypothetical protein